MRHLSNGPEEMCDIEMQSVSYDNLGHNEPGSWSDGDSIGEFSSQDDLINQVIAEGDDCMIDEENLFEDSISDIDMFEEISVDLQRFADSLSDLATDNSQTGSFIKEMLEFGGSSISNLAIFNEFEDDVLEDENYFEHQEEMLVEETTANIQIFINGANEKWEILKNSLRETSTRSVYNTKDDFVKPKPCILNEKSFTLEESILHVPRCDINTSMMSDFEKDMRHSEASASISNADHLSLSNIEKSLTVYSEESLLAVLESDTDDITDSTSTKSFFVEHDPLIVQNSNKHTKADIEDSINVYSEESVLTVLQSENIDLINSPSPKNNFVDPHEVFLTSRESYIDTPNIDKHYGVYSNKTLLALLKTDIDSNNPKNIYVDSKESFSNMQDFHISKPLKPDSEERVAVYSEELLSAVPELDTDNITDSPSLKDIYIDSGESFLTVKESHLNLHTELRIEQHIDNYSEESLLVVLESDTDNMSDSPIPNDTYVNSNVSLLTAQESHINEYTERNDDYSDESLLAVLESDTDNALDLDSPVSKNIYIDSKQSLMMAQELNIKRHTEPCIKDHIVAYSDDSPFGHLEFKTNVGDSIFSKNTYVDLEKTLKTQDLPCNKSTKPNTKDCATFYAEKLSSIVVKLSSLDFQKSCISKRNLVDSEESFLSESNIDNFTKPCVKQEINVHSQESLSTTTESSADPLLKQLIPGGIFDDQTEPHTVVLTSNFCQFKVPGRSDRNDLKKSHSLNNCSVESEKKYFFISPRSNTDKQSAKFSTFATVAPTFDHLSETEIGKHIDDDSEESFLTALRSDIDHPSELHKEKQDLFYSDESLLAVLDSDNDNVSKLHIPNKLTVNLGESLLTVFDANIDKPSKRETDMQMDIYSEESLLAVLESDIINPKKSHIEKDIAFHSDDSLLAALDSNNIQNLKPENGNSIIFETNESLSTALQSNLKLAKVAKQKLDSRKKVTSKPAESSGQSDKSLIEKDDLPFDCDVCGLKFKHASYLKRHKSIHNEVKDFECDKCIYKCKNVWALETHKKLHTDEKPFSCKLCDYKCKTAGYLKAHKVKHSKATPFSCPVCDLKFKTTRMLKFHKMTHDDESKLTCDVCYKKFTSPTNLRSHKIIHNDEEPLTCDRCNFSCKNLSYLTRHKKTHTQKPLACDLCNYECNSISSLKRHKITHSDEQPFSCELCGVKCKNGGILKQHMIIHSEDKPFACDLCEYRCKRASYLKTHKAVHVNKNGSSNPSQYLNLQQIQTQ